MEEVRINAKGRKHVIFLKRVNQFWVTHFRNSV